VSTFRRISLSAFSISALSFFPSDDIEIVENQLLAEPEGRGRHLPRHAMHAFRPGTGERFYACVRARFDGIVAASINAAWASALHPRNLRNPRFKSDPFWLRTRPLDARSLAIHRYYMPVATLRLTTAEKRRFNAEARRRGLSLSESLRRAGQAEASRVDWRTFFAATPPVALPPNAPNDLSAREGFGS
jgi:hypothetical protein